MAPPAKVIEAASELRVVLGLLVRRLRNEYALSIAHASVLGRLDRDGPLTASALAAAERVRPQSVAQTLAELESDGLIDRRPDPDDRRQVLVAATNLGRRRVAEERRRRDGWLATAISDLEPEEQRILIEAVPLLRRIAARL